MMVGIRGRDNNYYTREPPNFAPYRVPVAKPIHRASESGKRSEGRFWGIVGIALGNSSSPVKSATKSNAVLVSLWTGSGMN